MQEGFQGKQLVVGRGGDKQKELPSKEGAPDPVNPNI